MTPIDPTTTGELIPISNACHYLGGISRTKVFKLAQTGALKRVKIGKRAFILKSSIDAFIDRLIEEVP